MDGSTSLKRRRPYLHEEGNLEPYNQPGPSYAYSSDLYSSLLSSEQLAILQQAATILHIPSPDTSFLTRQLYADFIIHQAAHILGVTPYNLFQLPYQYTAEHRQKRPCPNLDSTMLPYFDNAVVQDVSTGHGPVDDDGFRHSFASQTSDGSSSFFSATATGVVQCLASLAPCPMTSAASRPRIDYQPMSTTTEHGQYFNSSMISQPIGVPQTVGYTTSSTQANLLTDDDTSSAQFTQSYPALQPTVSTAANAQLTSHQPFTPFEEMYYPNTQVDGDVFKFDHSETTPLLESIPAAAGLASHQPTPQTSAQATFVQADVPIISTLPPQPPPFPVGTADHLIPSPTSADAARHAVVSMRSTGDWVAAPPVVPSAIYAAAQHTTAYQMQHEQLQYSGPCCIREPNRDPGPSKQQPARRGPFKDLKDRLQTAETRKRGSCIRCRMQRIRCNADPENKDGPCLGCKKSLSRVWRLPCMRLKISDVILSKTCQVKGYEWTLRWKENSVLEDVGHWASTETRIIRVTEGYTNEYVELRVREFIPQEGDSLERSWFTPAGEKRSVRIPSFAIVEPESIKAKYLTYIKHGLISCYSQVLKNQRDSIIWPTYATAITLSLESKKISDFERKVLTTVLELWVTVRLTTKSFEIIGSETLGMPADILDETSPSCGKIPLPPVMGAQLDSVIIHQIQSTLREEALAGLLKLLTEGKAKSWYTSYLIVFILLHNASLVIKHDASYARKHGMDRRYARQKRVNGYHAGAMALLAYFHYCNKGVYPFTKDAKDQDIRNIANLDDEAMDFVRTTRDSATKHMKEWETIRENNEYENDFYFISQLYTPAWNAKAMVM